MPATKLKSALQLLGVTAADDAKAIRTAWLNLVRTYHPDMYRGDKAAANARLAEINAAYDLVDEYVSNLRGAAGASERRTSADRQPVERPGPERREQARQDRKKAAQRAQKAEAAKQAADAKAASERARAAQEPKSDRVDADAHSFEIELEALKAKRLADERRAKTAYKSRVARRAMSASRRTQAEAIAARAARAAFLAARKALESEYVEQGDRKKNRYA